MYTLKVKNDGKFEIFNIGRDKIVYSGIQYGKDEIVKSKTLKFRDVKDLMGHMASNVSLAVYRKMSKVLCAW